MRCKQPSPHVTEMLPFPCNDSLPKSTTVYKTVELRLFPKFVVQLIPCYKASLAHTAKLSWVMWQLGGWSTILWMTHTAKLKSTKLESTKPVLLEVHVNILEQPVSIVWSAICVKIMLFLLFIYPVLLYL